MMDNFASTYTQKREDSQKNLQKGAEISKYFDRHNLKSPKVKTKYLGDNELLNFSRDGAEPEEPHSATTKTKSMIAASPSRKTMQSVATAKTGLNKEMSDSSSINATATQNINSGSKEQASRRRSQYNKMRTSKLMTSRLGSDSDSNGSRASVSKIQKSNSRRKRLTSHKQLAKKEVFVHRPIPIPKSEEELAEMTKDEEFYEKTKDFRAQLRVRAMIKDRQDRVMQAKLGTTDHDPLYPIEFNSEAQ